MAALSDILSAIPWIVLLFFFIGEKWQQIKLIGVLAETLQRAQAGSTPAGAASSPAKAQPDAPVATVPAKSAPSQLPAAPTGPFADYPPWFQAALKEIGTHEEGVNGGPAIQRYINLAHAGSLGDPWCAIFACAMLESVGVRSPRSASSRAFSTDPNVVKLAGPAKGCFVVYWRGNSPADGIGHVGFYHQENATKIWTLGGNENDMVQDEALAKSGSNWGVIGYYWPASVPLPAIGAVQAPAGAPVSIQTAPSTSAPAAGGAWQTNIIATWFSSQESSNAGMTAYGAPLDNTSYGVALPFRFPSPRPQVEITNPKTGKTITCDIVDLGPWNINDPYWTTGARPQAESGFDLGQVSGGKPRKTNGAGIDLTFKAASDLGIDGKGIVNWRFADAATEPKVT